MKSKVIGIKNIKDLITPRIIRSNIKKALGDPAYAKIKYKLSGISPSEMIIDLSAVCNAQCPFCPRVYMPTERSKGYMSDHIFQKCVDEAIKSKIKTIRLYSTAEPTLHPKFAKYIDQLVDNGFLVEVSTNAFTMHKHFDALMKVHFLQYSIEGWDKDSYEKFRYPLKFKKVRDNINKFWEASKDKKHRPVISCNLLITKSTDIDKFLDCWGHFVDEIKVHPLLGTTYFKEGNFLTEKPIEIKDDYFDSEKKSQFVCSYPFEVVTIAFDGKIALCCADFSAELPLGSVENGVGEIYGGPIFESVRENFYNQKHTVCKECNAFLEPTIKAREIIINRLKNSSHPLAYKLVPSF